MSGAESMIARTTSTGGSSAPGRARLWVAASLMALAVSGLGATAVAGASPSDTPQTPQLPLPDMSPSQASELAAKADKMPYQQCLLFLNPPGDRDNGTSHPNDYFTLSGSTPRSIDGLRRRTQQRSTATRRKITKALCEMRKKGLAINPHALANYAGVARKSIYNHPDLLEQIRAESTHPGPRPAPAGREPANQSSVVAALREQFRAQKQRYETEIADLKAENKRLERALAAAHVGLHRRGDTATSIVGRDQAEIELDEAGRQSPNRRPCD